MAVYYPELEERTVRLPRKSPGLSAFPMCPAIRITITIPQRNYQRSRLRRVDNGRRLLNGDYKRSTSARRYRPQHLRSRQLTPSYMNYQHQKPTHHQHYQQQDALLLNSFDSLTDDEIREYDVTSGNEGEDVLDLERLKLSRDKLRVALAREERNDILGQYKSSLRDRLQYPLRKSPNKELLSPPVQQLPDGLCLEEGAEANALPSAPSPGGDPAELSLRLIALKSAIIKKHMARKKRDAERAYSPTGQD
ncbi:GL10474 [Drosophila persimilis]|uniref:GL10474 n=1 Tax=Drosophila persimilis TaxID=7234 RepID=B4GC13_DROPE|nr:GL10474 [Drosophila persimilis]